MKNLICTLAAAALVASGCTAGAAQPTGSDPMAECHKVFSEVGLVIRAEPSSKGRKVGSVEKGERVKLAGEVLAGSGAVYPIIQKDAEGSFWVKIKAPKAGYVLYSAADDDDYTYLVPCSN